MSSQCRGLSNSCFPLCARVCAAEETVALKTFTVVCKMLRIRIGQARSRSLRKRRAFAAVLLLLDCGMKTQRGGAVDGDKQISGARISVPHFGRYFTVDVMYPGS